MDKQIDLDTLSVTELKAIKSDLHDELARVQRDMQMVLVVLQRKITEEGDDWKNIHRELRREE